VVTFPPAFFALTFYSIVFIVLLQVRKVNFLDR